MKGTIVRKGRARSSLIKDPDTLRAGRERLVEVALGLFQELGFHQTSVRAIAERAGISVGTLFNYFSGKDELLLHLLNSGQEVWETPMRPLRADLDAAIERQADPDEILTTLFTNYVRMVHDTRHYVLLAYQETKSLVSTARRELFDRERRLMTIFEGALLYGAERGRWPAGAVRLKAHSIVMLAQIWAVRRWILSQELTSPEEYAAQLTPMVIGIAEASDANVAGLRAALEQNRPEPPPTKNRPRTSRAAKGAAPSSGWRSAAKSE